MTEVYAFQPTQIPGCSLWLDAADASTFTLSGSSVTQWRDKSGGGWSAIQNNALGYPTIVGRSVNFAPNQALRIGNFGYNPSWTAFVAINSVTLAPRWLISYFNSVGVNIVPMGMNEGGNKIFNGLLPSAPLDIIGNHIEMTTAQNTTTNSLFAWFRDGVSQSTYTANPSIAVSATASLGIGANQTGDYDVGGTYVIYELLFYKSYLTTSERQQIEGYLGWKWGLSKSLPTNHPHYNRTPFSRVIPLPLESSVSLVNSVTPSFIPTQIAGCQLWLDGVDPNGNGVSPDNGTTIVSWIDKSGNNRNTPATGTPIYSKNILNNLGAPLLNKGSSYFITPSFIPAKNGDPSIFIIVKQNSYGGTNNSDFFTSSAGYQYLDFLGALGTSVLNGYVYNRGQLSTPYSINQALLISFIGTTTYSGTLYGNGSTTGTAFSGSSGFNLNTNMGFFIGGGGGFIGYLYEIIMYGYALSTPQKQQVEGYLAWKWGLQANLPSNHPHKLVSPINLTVPLTFPLVVSQGIRGSFFSPLNITGCSLWLDGRDVNANGIQPQNGGFISTWRDKSGNNRNAIQNTPSLQPTYRDMSIVFPNLKYLNMTDAFNMLSSVGKYYSIFVVERRRSNKVQNFILGFGGSAGNSGIAFGYNENTIFSHTSAYIADTLYTTDGYQPTDPTRIWSGGYNGSIRDLVLNGTTVSTTNPYTYATTSWTQPCIGFLPLVGINQYYVGNIYEILFYNRYLTITQRQQVEGYLAWKWGIQSSLPTTHPWLRFPPPPL